MKFLLLTAMFLSQAAFADNDRYFLQDQDFKFEVELDKEENAAQVRVIEAKKKLPKFLDLVLYRSKKSPLTVSVRALDVKEANPTYTGAIDLDQDNYTGLALQWNFEAGKKRLNGKKQD